MDSVRYNNIFRKTSVKIVLFFVYFITVNLMSGYVAVWLKFHTMWGNSQVFLDYAMPIGLTSAMAHWPSLIMVSIPLLMIPNWNSTQLKRFRIICVTLFLILLYGVMGKIPFALFPAVDLFVAFFFSLIIVPPTQKENPVLTIFTKALLIIILLVGIYIPYTKWQHQTPAIKEIDLLDGLFKLKTIRVDDSYRKELIFTIELTKHISQEEVCNIASEMGETLFDTYPFDKDYKKIADVIFNPEKENNNTAYRLGELSEYQENNETKIGCYLKYK